MDWFLRLREPSRSNNDDHDFSIWFNRSADHQQAWSKACHAWEVMGEISPINLPNRNSPGTMRVSPSRQHGRHRAVGIGLGAIAACLIVMTVAPSFLTQYQADFTTATAEIRRVTLADGSTIDLGASSAIAVDFSPIGRHVRLLSGEAFFDVRPDATRPFTVNAGGELDITVVGTAFDVNLTPQRASVQLAHGVIDLSSFATGTRMELKPGDFVSLDRSNGQLSRTSVSIDAIAAWRDGKLFVQDVPISTVVAELQRYHASWITIASGELGARRITGLYDLSDPDRALDALVSPYGAKVHHVSPYLRVLSFF
ncbi:DUF4974 domain-containing protein [Rhizobiales bacterium RZME27]|uniref:DUF4974 domain-containing protein n=1 Tax=Endobacterium cereale TaxID=2663029 RepID=A0A6A8AHA4_9HYPH|nr:FecR family protein [Endobacterium cereale]MEB2847347.1 FecR family protein [Endobacterium cereale]MQY49197.1 DUF4974 domain-containing protein [Endobacterium cereale]